MIVVMWSSVNISNITNRNTRNKEVWGKQSNLSVWFASKAIGKNNQDVGFEKHEGEKN